MLTMKALAFPRAVVTTLYLLIWITTATTKSLAFNTKVLVASFRYGSLGSIQRISTTAPSSNTFITTSRSSRGALASSSSSSLWSLFAVPERRQQQQRQTRTTTTTTTTRRRNDRNNNNNNSGRNQTTTVTPSSYFSTATTTKVKSGEDEELSRSSSSSDSRRRRTTSRSRRREGSLPYTFSVHAMMQHDILTREQELELGKQVQQAKLLCQQIMELEQQQQQQSLSSTSTADKNIDRSHDDPINRDSLYYYHIPSSSNITELEIVHGLGIVGGQHELRRILRRGSHARQELIRSNIRLVVSIAQQWLGRRNRNNNNNRQQQQLSMDEVIQEGILGLAQAVERYDPQYQLRFGTYATHWITSYIRRCCLQHNQLQKGAGLIKVPWHYHRLMQDYYKAVRQYAQEHGSTEATQYDSATPTPASTAPTLEQIAIQLHVSPKRLKSIISIMTRSWISLDAPPPSSSSSTKGGSSYAGSGGSSSSTTMDHYYNHIPSPDLSPEQAVEYTLLRQCLEHAMSTELSPHERDVLRLRLGLDDGVSRTLRQVAQVMFMTSTSTTTKGTKSYHQDDDIHNDNENSMAPTTTHSMRSMIFEIRAAEQRALKKLRSPYSLHTHQLLQFYHLLEDTPLSSSSWGDPPPRP